MHPKDRLPFVLCWLGAIIALAGEVLIGFSATRDFVLIESKKVSIDIGILMLVGGFFMYLVCFNILKSHAIQQEAH